MDHIGKGYYYFSSSLKLAPVQHLYLTCWLLTGRTETNFVGESKLWSPVRNMSVSPIQGVMWKWLLLFGFQSNTKNCKKYEYTTLQAKAQVQSLHTSKQGKVNKLKCWHLIKSISWLYFIYISFSFHGKVISNLTRLNYVSKCSINSVFSYKWLGIWKLFGSKVWSSA